MTREELRQLVAKVRLPPQLSLRVEFGINDLPYLMVASQWDDVYQPGKDAMAFNQTILHPETPRNVIMDQIYIIVRELWMHELHEWFTVEGAHYITPHPDGLNSLA